MADAILDVGRIGIKGTETTYKTFVENVRKRFTSGGKPDGTAQKEPPMKKTKLSSSRQVAVTSSDSSSNDSSPMDKEEASEEEKSLEDSD